jgi:predicted RNA-binding protein (virulence factor B family)
MEVGSFINVHISQQNSSNWIGVDNENQNINLPKIYCKNEFKIGDKVDVFVDLNDENEFIGVPFKPYALVNQVAYLKAVDVNSSGAYMDWGAHRELLIPYSMQEKSIEENKKYLCFIYADRTTGKLLGSTKLKKFIENEELTVTEREKVIVTVVNPSDLGYNVIVNHKHYGLIYYSDVFTNLNEGDVLEAYVKTVREDKKLDIVIQKPGHEAIESTSKKILDYLKKNNGVLNLGDKSDPDDIYHTLQMSKKIFKKALGSLYKQRLVILEDFCTKLI